jgi:hypothetical protein
MRFLMRLPEIMRLPESGEPQLKAANGGARFAGFKQVL